MHGTVYCVGSQVRTSGFGQAGFASGPRSGPKPCLWSTAAAEEGGGLLQSDSAAGSCGGDTGAAGPDGLPAGEW